MNSFSSGLPFSGFTYWVNSRWRVSRSVCRQADSILVRMAFSRLILVT